MDDWFIPPPKSFLKINRETEEFLNLIFPEFLEQPQELDFEELLECRTLARKYRPFRLEHNPTLEDCYAKYNFITRKVEILPDVYDKLMEGDKRQRFTAAHEVYHADIHGAYFESMPEAMYLNRSKATYPIYRNAEWQANTAAAAYLMPVKTLRMILPDTKPYNELWELSNIFGISEESVEIRLKVLRKHGLI